MTQEELMPINVWLAGRTYRLRIKPEEEEAVRKAVKVADEKIADMRLNYPGDEQDFMALTILSYAADTGVLAMSNPLVQDELKKLADRIDKLI